MLFLDYVRHEVLKMDCNTHFGTFLYMVWKVLEIGGLVGVELASSEWNRSFALCSWLGLRTSGAVSVTAQRLGSCVLVVSTPPWENSLNSSSQHLRPLPKAVMVALGTAVSGRTHSAWPLGLGVFCSRAGSTLGTVCSLWTFFLFLENRQQGGSKDHSITSQAETHSAGCLQNPFPSFPLCDSQNACLLIAVSVWWLCSKLSSFPRSSMLQVDYAIVPIM